MQERIKKQRTPGVRNFYRRQMYPPLAAAALHVHQIRIIKCCGLSAPSTELLSSADEAMLYALPGPHSPRLHKHNWFSAVHLKG